MLYNMLNYNEFRDACHSASVAAGWWKTSERYSAPEFTTDVSAPPVYMPDPDRLTVPTKLCLVHSELSEASRGYFSGAADDHLPLIPSAPVEFGDVKIRIGDLAGYLEIDLGAAVLLVMQADHVEISDVLAITWDGQIYLGPHAWFNLLHTWVDDAMEAYRKKDRPDRLIPSMSGVAAAMARIVILLDIIAKRNEWDLPAITEAKMTYNAVRPDHKPEYRATAEDGKLY